jgi:hypothetical protein
LIAIRAEENGALPKADALAGTDSGDLPHRRFACEDQIVFLRHLTYSPGLVSCFVHRDCGLEEEAAGPDMWRTDGVSVSFARSCSRCGLVLAVHNARTKLS